MTVNDNYPVLDGNGAIKTFPAQLVDGVYWPANIMVGLAGSVPTVVSVDPDTGCVLTTETLPASGRTPVEGNFTATGRSATFGPIPGRGFNITLSGTFVATVILERSFDQGATWYPLTGSGYPIYNWTAAASEMAVEDETDVIYSLRCVWTSGTAAYRISQ